MQNICSLPSYYPNALVFLFHFFFGFCVHATALFALETFLWWGCEKHHEIKELIKCSHQIYDLRALWLYTHTCFSLSLHLEFQVFPCCMISLACLRKWISQDLILVGRNNSEQCIKKKSYCPWLSGPEDWFGDLWISWFVLGDFLLYQRLLLFF